MSVGRIGHSTSVWTASRSFQSHRPLFTFALKRLATKRLPTHFLSPGVCTFTNKL